jgi:hypothetical protein
LRTEVSAQNVNSFVTVLNSIISLNHPEANLNFLATFLWCILKARNDELFCIKKTRPHQISMHAKALLKDLEVLPQPETKPLQIAKATDQAGVEHFKRHGKN